MIVLFVNKRISPKSIGIFLGSAAGALGGFMVLALEALRITYGTSVLSWLISIYLYVYFFCGIASFFIKQFAFERGDMNAVAPAFYGVMVLYPSIAAYFVSNVTVQTSQIISYIGIGVSIALISM